MLPGESVNRDEEGIITQIVGRFYNRANESARGFDFGVQYQIATAFGTFSSSTRATFLESWIFTDVTTGERLERRSSPAFADGDAWLKWKARSGLEWAWKSFDLVGTVTHLDGYHEFAPPDFTVERWVRQTWTFDMQASYAIPKRDTASRVERLVTDTTITLGCNNIFDRDPPRAFVFLQAGYPDYLYDSTGRFIYVKLTKKF